MRVLFLALVLSALTVGAGRVHLHAQDVVDGVTQETPTQDTPEQEFPSDIENQDTVGRGNVSDVTTTVVNPADPEASAEGTTIPSFENILDRQLSTDESAMPAPQGEDEGQHMIDPDFLLEEGKSYDDYPTVSIRILDKITAQSKTYDLDVGKTVAYGGLRIRPMACKKAPPIEEPESAAFLQIWEKGRDGQDAWIFSGWMFASSPSLSAMEHPVFDVWIVDCKE